MADKVEALFVELMMLGEDERQRLPVVYRNVPSGIEIVVIAHQHRRSGYWRNRVEEPAAVYAAPLAA